MIIAVGSRKVTKVSLCYDLRSSGSKSRSDIGGLALYRVLREEINHCPIREQERAMMVIIVTLPVVLWFRQMTVVVIVVVVKEGGDASD